MLQWWGKQNAQWSRGGGSLAAASWWLAFVLFTGIILFAPSTVFRDSRSKPSATRSLSNFKQIGVALQMYIQDNGERIPPMCTPAAMRHALHTYSKHGPWQVPGNKKPYAVNSSLSLRPLKAYPAPDKIVAIWDTRVFSEKYHVVGFLDGHAKAVPQSEWDKLRLASGIANDVPPPPEPSLWKKISRGAFLLLFFLFIAVTAMLVAAAREARLWTVKHGGNPTLTFTGWFLFRFLGHGSLILLASLTASIIVSLFWTISLLVA